jgi:hypothetical protein
MVSFAGPELQWKVIELTYQRISARELVEQEQHHRLRESGHVFTALCRVLTY